jgi:glutamate/tyrosine decarboxylase-like PLP-dependent enzyme
MSSGDPTFSRPLNAAVQHALAHLGALDSLPVGAQANAKTLRDRLAKPLDAAGVDAEQVIQDLAVDVSGGLHTTGSGRFFAWVIGGSLPAALAADWLTSAWDQNAHNYGCGPAAAVAEEVVGGWLKSVLGLPDSASFALVTGCQMAHTTCLAAARHAVLEQRGWDVEKLGLYGATPIRILSTEQAHGSIERALRFLGLGTVHWTQLPADSNGQLPPDVLTAALATDPSAPTIVILQAGDLNIGAFDRFAELIPIAKKHGAWVHVDGAFGLWVAASPRHKHLLRGVESADSWATDGHKWLNVPYDCGYALIADSSAHAKAMAHRASYISYSSEARDQADWNPEWSRRARGFASYAALRQLGTDGVKDLIERCCEHTTALVCGIGSLPGAEIVWKSQINQGLVRFLDTKPTASAADHDRRTNDVIEYINATGEAFFSGTTWRGRRAMRVSVCNWQTDAADVERTIACVARILER